MAGIIPLADRVLLKRTEAADRVGVIIIPDNAKEKLGEGEVIAVGEGKMDARGNIHPLSVKPGDMVLFSKYVGIEVQLDGEEYLIVGEHEILGKVTGDSKAAGKAPAADTETPRLNSARS